MYYAMLVNYVLDYTGKDIETVRAIIATYKSTKMLPQELEDIRYIFEYVVKETATVQ
jgi:hypothetical protein